MKIDFIGSRTMDQIFFCYAKFAVLAIHLQRCMLVYDQNFYWGGAGVVDEEGSSSKRCLKWSGGGGGSLRNLSKNILKQGVSKGKNCP